MVDKVEKIDNLDEMPSRERVSEKKLVIEKDLVELTELKETEKTVILNEHRFRIVWLLFGLTIVLIVLVYSLAFFPNTVITNMSHIMGKLDTILTGFLLPLFTLVLGFYFGKN